MRKMFKRFAAMGSAMVMAATTSVMVFAQEITDNTAISGNNATVDQNEYQDYLDTLTDEQLQILQSKEQMMKNGIEPSIGARAVTKISIPGTFTMYQQETDTYCIPACIKSLLMYVNGQSPSQTAINSDVKMSFTTIPGYVNEFQDKCQYILSTNPSQTNLTTCVYMDIVYDEVPAFLRLSGTTSSTWYYSTSGHCVLANAIYSDKSQIQIADPLGGRVSGCPYFYLKSASTVARYTTHVCY